MPESHGGGGSYDFRFNAVVSEELAYAGMGGAGNGIGLQNDIVSPYFIAYCTDEQKDRWWPGIASGEKILAIWNERVAAIRARYRHVRTVVLVKSPDLLEVSAFELDTVIYPAEAFRWSWNQNDNLEGFSRSDDEHRFTWQPHGSQFTLIESAPESRLCIRLKQPPKLDRETILRAIEFDPDWIQTIPSGDPHGHLFED